MIAVLRVVLLRSAFVNALVPIADRLNGVLGHVISRLGSVGSNSGSGVTPLRSCSVVAEPVPSTHHIGLGLGPIYQMGRHGGLERRLCASRLKSRSLFTSDDLLMKTSEIHTVVMMMMMMVRVVLLSVSSNSLDDCLESKATPSPHGPLVPAGTSTCSRRRHSAVQRGDVGQVPLLFARPHHAPRSPTERGGEQVGTGLAITRDDIR